MEQNIALKIEGVSKRYEIGKEKDSSLRATLSNIFKSAKTSKDEFWALKDVSFEVKKGDVVGIIGKNGAGKSTLLKILSQITKPTEGRIIIDGRIASLLEVGTGFHPELTGRENIYLNGTILGMTRKEVKSKFDEIVAFSGIEKFIDTPVKHYSSGQYVRLAFSVAAHLDPEILVIDEVLAVGDAEFQKKCLGKMKDVAGEGRTVLFVSHHLGSIKQLCNKGIILNHGQLEYVGNVNEAITKYQLNQEASSIYKNKEHRNHIFIEEAKFSNNDGQYYAEDNFQIIFKIKNLHLINGDIRLLFRVISSEEQVVCSQEIGLQATYTNYSFNFNDNIFTKGQYYINTIIYQPGIHQIENIGSLITFNILNNNEQFAHLETFDIGSVYLKNDWSYAE